MSNAMSDKLLPWAEQGTVAARSGSLLIDSIYYPGVVDAGISIPTKSGERLDWRDPKWVNVCELVEKQLPGAFWRYDLIPRTALQMGGFAVYHPDWRMAPGYSLFTRRRPPSKTPLFSEEGVPDAYIFLLHRREKTRFMAAVRLALP